MGIKKHNNKDVINVNALDEDKYDRSNRLAWFNLDLVHNTKILVIGAGAIGNETCKNLYLSGFRNISLVDMDYIVRSNLNRCLFFSDIDADQKKPKATIIAVKVKQIDETVQITPYIKKIQDMPESFIPEHDIVLGCLDNVAARIHVNAFCYYHTIPYIDAATLGLIGKVHVIIPPITSCLECAMNKTHKKMYNIRMSCTGRDVTFIDKKLAADINTTSIVSAIQVQEAVKIAHQRFDYVISNLFYFDGNRNVFDILEIPVNTDCPHHNK